MYKKPQYIAIGLVVALAVILLSLPAQSRAQLNRWISTLFVVGFEASETTESLADRTRAAVTPRKVLTKQIEDLQEEIQRLRLQNKQLESVTRENTQLRDLLAWKKQTPRNVKSAQVVGRDPANWHRMVLINLGVQHGMIENMPVMTNNGLVGRISAVGETQSQVLLIGDPNCQVGALVESTGESGIIGPATSTTSDPKLINLLHIAADSKIEPGDRVITSGLGTIFPKGIPIGSIVHARTEASGLTLKARVRLFANVNRLENIWVLMK